MFIERDIHRTFWIDMNGEQWNWQSLMFAYPEKNCEE